MVMIKTISICVFFVVSLLVGETTQEPGILFYGEEAWTQAKDYFTQPSTCHEGRPIDCNGISDKCQSGVDKVFPKQTQGFDVYCEMNLDGGHWTKKGSTRIVQTENTTDVSIIGCADMCLADQQCCFASYSKGASTCRIDTSGRCFVETETLDEWMLIHHNSYQERPVDCNDIPNKFQSGVYKVFPNQTHGFDVYCEMNIDEGHWTVFQRGENGYVDFYRGWNEYKTGFGDLTNEFWLGNENLHYLTSQNNYELRIELIDFDGNTAFAKYKEFAIGDESLKFKLTANAYHGTAGNSFAHHNGHRFSTKDSDNDNHANHCATMFPGAWWFNHCVTSDLNGQYFQMTPDSAHRGIYWHLWKGNNYSLKGSLMMMRRVSN